MHQHRIPPELEEVQLSHSAAGVSRKWASSWEGPLRNADQAGHDTQPTVRTIKSTRVPPEQVGESFSRRILVNEKGMGLILFIYRVSRSIRSDTKGA